MALYDKKTERSWYSQYYGDYSDDKFIERPGVYAMKTIVIDGNNFNDYKGFTNELSVQLDLSEDFTNLNAIDDVLYGGVVGFDTNDRVQFVWHNSAKSKSDMGNEFYVNWLLKEKLEIENSEQPHLTSREVIEWSNWYDKKIQEVRNDETMTFYQFLTDMIKDHPNIEFIES